MARKITDSEKQRFIEDNRSLIPASSVNGFDAKTLDQKYVLMTTYVRKDREKSTMEGQVKTYLKSKNVNIDEVKSIISLCQSWMERNKTKLIEQVDAKIRKLQEEREKYNKM